MSEAVYSALAALSSLHQAKRWLDDVPGFESASARNGQSQQAPRRLTARSASRLDSLLRAERAERSAWDIPSTAQPAPLRAAVIDAQQQVHRAGIDAAFIASSALRQRPLLMFGPAWYVVAGSAWDAVVMQLRVAIPWLVCACPDAPADHTPHPGCWWHTAGCLQAAAVELAAVLSAADDQARLVLGVGPCWVSVPGLACAHCRSRTMEAEVSNADRQAWIFRCREGCWIGPAADCPVDEAMLARLGQVSTLRS